MVQKKLRNFSQWFGTGFQNGMMEGEKMESYKKNFWNWSVFSSQNIDFPFYLKRLLELSFFQYFFFLFFSLFFYALPLKDLGGFDDIRGEKSLFQQLLFKWNGVDLLSVDIDGGHIF
jgi:hypothetical protein